MVTTTYASAPDATGFSERHGSLGGKSPRGIAPGAFRLRTAVGVLQRRSSAEVRTAATQAAQSYVRVWLLMVSALRF